MATTATLTAGLTAATSNTTNPTTENNKRIIEDNRKPIQCRSASISSMDLKTSTDIEFSDKLNGTNLYRMSKLENSVNDPSLSPTETNEVSSIITGNNPSLNRQSSDDVNSQQGKRKFSLSQYKERKKLKSDEFQTNALGDTDMRINVKTSPPTSMDEDPIAPIVSPKLDETIKDVVIKSNLSEPGVKKTNKKKVIWADEKNQSLVQTSFFEVDDSELSDMHIFARNCAANISIAQLEKVMERDLRQRRGIQDVNGLDTDDKQYSTPLPNLIKILLPETIQSPPIISQERFIQEEREKTVLQALFIRSFLPDSPGEPDGDVLPSNSERNEPKLIPLDDDTGTFTSSKVSSVNSHLTSSTSTTNVPLVSTTNTPTTSTLTPSLSSFSFSDISPEVAHILAQAKGNLSSASANQSSTTNPSITTTTLTTTNTTTLLPPPNFFSLLNGTRTTPTELPPVPSLNLLPNLPLNINLPTTTPPFPFNQLLVSAALSLRLPPPPAPNTNPSLFPSVPSSTFNSPQPVSPPSSQTTATSTSINNTKTPSVRFVSAIGHQARPNLTHQNDHQLSSTSRENSRDHHFRRGSHHHHNNNHHHRRDYYPNRHQNNRNIFQ